jgi:tetratricopeptide (TPR) repeat protein
VWGKIGGYVPAPGFIESAKPVVDLYSEMPTVQATLKKNPNDPAANCKMAQVEAAAGNVDKAEARLKKAEAAKYKGANLAKAYNGVGDYFQLKNNMDPAIRYFLKAQAASKNPADASYALVSIMTCYAGKGDKANANKYAKMLINLKGGTPEYVQIAKQQMGGGKAITKRRSGSKEPADFRGTDLR